MGEFLFNKKLTTYDQRYLQSLQRYDVEAKYFLFCFWSEVKNTTWAANTFKWTIKSLSFPVIDKAVCLSAVLWAPDQERLKKCREDDFLLSQIENGNKETFKDQFIPWKLEI